MVRVNLIIHLLSFLLDVYLYAISNQLAVTSCHSPDDKNCTNVI